MSEYRRMLASIAGEKAARAGKPRTSCNRERGTIFFDDWHDGFDHGERERLRETHPMTSNTEADDVVERAREICARLDAPAKAVGWLSGEWDEHIAMRAAIAAMPSFRRTPKMPNTADDVVRVVSRALYERRSSWSRNPNSKTFDELPEVARLQIDDDARHILTAIAAMPSSVGDAKDIACIALTAELPKERWSCSDDESGTNLTLQRQRRFIYDTILDRLSTVPETKDEGRCIRYSDEGLREPVKSFEETFSGFDLLKEHFLPRDLASSPQSVGDEELKRHVANLQSLLEGLPDYEGSDLRAVHYGARRSALQAAVAALTNTAPLVEALEKCRDKFREYENLHTVKYTAEGYEKAARNREMADMCDQALSQYNGKGDRR